MSRTGPQISVSAIVVTYNSARSIKACLKALSAEVEAVGGEVFLFDNSSTDATVESVRSEFPNVRIYESPENIGFAAANNSAASMVGGRYLLFANPDMVIDKGTTGFLIDALEKNPNAGASVARMRNTDDSFQPTCRNFPNMKNIFFSRGSILSSVFRALSRNDNYTLGDYREIVEVPAASATCMLVEKEFFQSLGGFDNRFFLFMEDTDLCLRIKQARRKVYFVPRAGGIHYWGNATSISPLKRSWYHHVSVWKYFLKHYPNGFSVFVLPLALLLNFVIKMLTGLRRK